MAFSLSTPQRALPPWTEATPARDERKDSPASETVPRERRSDCENTAADTLLALQQHGPSPAPAAPFCFQRIAPPSLQSTRAC